MQRVLGTRLASVVEMLTFSVVELEDDRVELEVIDYSSVKLKADQTAEECIVN